MPRNTRLKFTTVRAILITSGIVINLSWIITAVLFDFTHSLKCNLDSTGSCATPSLLYGVVLTTPLVLGSILLILGLVQKSGNLVSKLLITLTGSSVLVFIQVVILGALTIAVHGI